MLNRKDVKTVLQVLGITDVNYQVDGNRAIVKEDNAIFVTSEELLKDNKRLQITFDNNVLVLVFDVEDNGHYIVEDLDTKLEEMYAVLSKDNIECYSAMV